MCFRRWFLALAFLASMSGAVRADIFRWDNGRLIPGTEGITPGPGVQLDHRALAYARLRELDLNGSRFDSSNLSHAVLFLSNLTNANLSGANLSNAFLESSTLTNANLSGAVVTAASFIDTTSYGFTKEQLYSTASYQAKNLEGIVLWFNGLGGWDFNGQNLANADMHLSTLTNANLSGAKLSNAKLWDSTLTNADLRGAVVTGASFTGTTYRGFIKEQLYSTASYQAKNLTGIEFQGDNLRAWDFSGQNLSNADFTNAKLANAILSGAMVTGTKFNGTTSQGFTKEQLYSTASYQDGDLQGVDFTSNNLGGWDLHDQNLANAVLYSATLSNANLSGANLTNTNLVSTTLMNTNLNGAVVTGAFFLDTTPQGFKKEQLYSTASYQAKNLQGIGLSYNSLNGWDFHGQNLANAKLEFATLNNSNLSFTDTRGAQGLDLTGAMSVNAILPDGTIAGLNLAASDQLVVRNYHGDPNRSLGPIPLNVQDNMTMGDGGVLQLLLDADAWDSTISFEPGISVALDGTLELAFADGVAAAAQAGRTFDVFDWTGVSPIGAFAVDSDYLWDLTNLYTSGEITLVSALTGDTDGDGLVGLNDLNHVRNHFGETGAPGMPGDAIPFDGIVDLADLNAVRNNFGAAAQAVPEPGSLKIAVLAFGIAAFGWRRLRCG